MKLDFKNIQAIPTCLKIHNCAESIGITECMWIQVCIGHSGVYRGPYRDVKGRLFVSYKSYLVLLKYMIG